jgi:hypothetical protein
MRQNSSWRPLWRPQIQQFAEILTISTEGQGDLRNRDEWTQSSGVQYYPRLCKRETRSCDIFKLTPHWLASTNTSASTWSNSNIPTIHRWSWGIYIRPNPSSWHCLAPTLQVTRSDQVRMHPRRRGRGRQGQARSRKGGYAVMKERKIGSTMTAGNPTNQPNRSNRLAGRAWYPIIQCYWVQTYCGWC